MSHEIRTPMNGVPGALELLRQTPLDLRQRRLVKTAAVSGESLMDILNDALDHSKIEAGKLVLASSPMSLHSVAASATARFRAHAESRGLRITLRLNAHSAGPDAAAVHFEVQDSGIGIPQHALQQVFQPFHQVDSTRSRLHGGTGLGLAISQRIVHAMGGRIEVRSQGGVGSTFSFTLLLPLARHEPLPQQDSGFGGLEERATLAGVVLLVEDNPVNRLIGAEMLMSFGVEVREAEDGAQALALLERQGVDLVLMDIQMPQVDGHAATRLLRESENRLRLPRVPIVALTANAFDEVAALSMAAGMDGHLSKPYSRAQLLELLRRWL